MRSFLISLNIEHTNNSVNSGKHKYKSQQTKKKPLDQCEVFMKISIDNAKIATRSSMEK